MCASVKSLSFFLEPLCAVSTVACVQYGAMVELLNTIKGGLDRYPNVEDV